MTSRQRRPAERKATTPTRRLRSSLAVQKDIRRELQTRLDVNSSVADLIRIFQFISEIGDSSTSEIAIRWVKPEEEEEEEESE